MLYCDDLQTAFWLFSVCFEWIGRAGFRFRQGDHRDLNAKEELVYFTYVQLVLEVLFELPLHQDEVAAAEEDAVKIVVVVGMKPR